MHRHKAGGGTHGAGTVHIGVEPAHTATVGDGRAKLLV